MLNDDDDVVGVGGRVTSTQGHIPGRKTVHYGNDPYLAGLAAQAKEDAPMDGRALDEILRRSEG